MPRKQAREEALPELEPHARTDSDAAESACPAMRAALESARTVAATRATVLLTGETGVGKGVLAHRIHAWSHRSHGPFVSVHCAALPETLLESELFGHERGAFTGAERRTRGKFELADKGTLFLDEVDTIPLSAQVTLLDVLQEKRFRRIGGEQDLEVDVRVIAATNADLDRAQQEGRFRPDLFHRLNVFPIEIPPLRERIADLPVLTEQVLARLNLAYGKQIQGLDPRVENALQAYSWPGNVRELENLLERAYILESSSLIRAEHLPIEVTETAEAASKAPAPEHETLGQVRDRTVARAEYCYLEKLLTAHHGRIDASAAEAGVTPRQLRNLLRRHGLRKEAFKRPGRPD